MTSLSRSLSYHIIILTLWAIEWGPLRKTHSHQNHIGYAVSQVTVIGTKIGTVTLTNDLKWSNVEYDLQIGFSFDIFGQVVDGSPVNTFVHERSNLMKILEDIMGQIGCDLP